MSASYCLVTTISQAILYYHHLYKLLLNSHQIIFLKKQFCYLVGRMDGNLTQNHLSLAHSSVKKTQRRVTMYSNRYQKHAFVSTFLNSKSDLGCAENGSERKLGKVRSGSQKHLICCRVTWLCVIPRMHHTVRNEGVWTGAHRQSFA